MLRLEITENPVIENPHNKNTFLVSGNLPQEPTLPMQIIKSYLDQLINISNEEFEELLTKTYLKEFERNEVLSYAEKIPENGFIIMEGGVRLILVDLKGNEKTFQFIFENQIVGDYQNMIRKKKSIFSIQAIEKTQVLVIPFSTIEWAFENFKEGAKLGRILAEQTFFQFENRIIDLYLRSPKERYDNLSTLYPNIHNRVPQHMIASYLGITPIHLSRLKKKDIKT